MSEPVEASGHTVEEAIDAALEMLGATEDEVEIQILADPEGPVRRPGDARVRVRLRDERTDEDRELERQIADEEADRARQVSPEVASRQASAARAFLEGLLDAMDLDGDVDATADAYGVSVQIHGGDLAVLIGRHGHTLAALQELTRATVQKESLERAVVSVDIEGYQARREEILERKAMRAAATVRKTQQAFSFEPMPARDRKVIHDTLTGYSGVRTASEGQEPQRYVVILPA